MQRAREPPPEATHNGGDEEEEEDDEEVAAPLSPPAAAAANAGAPSPAAAASPPPPSPPPSSAAAASPSTPVSGAAAASSSSSSSSSGGGAASGSAGDASGGGECPHIGLTLRSNFVDAQNTWDAIMAHSILQALEALPAGALVVHVCGKFHSEQRLGICEHLAAAPLSPGRGAPPRVCVVACVPLRRGVAMGREVLLAGRLQSYGDWLVVTDGRLTRSFGPEHPV